nr:photoreceptor disk component PRCD isoform X1 [Manis javanica]
MVPQELDTGHIPYTSSLGAQWSRWSSYGQQLGNRPPVLRQGERASEVSPHLSMWSSARGTGINWLRQVGPTVRLEDRGLGWCSRKNMGGLARRERSKSSSALWSWMEVKSRRVDTFQELLL